MSQSASVLWCTAGLVLSCCVSLCVVLRDGKMMVEMELCPSLEGGMRGSERRWWWRSDWRLALAICHPAGSLSFSLGPEWVRYTFTSSNSTFAYGSRWGTGRHCKVNGENVKRIIHQQMKIVIIHRPRSEMHIFLCIDLTRSSLQQQYFLYFTYNESGQQTVAVKLQNGQKATIHMYHLP